MIVRDLIAMLAAMPPDVEVLISSESDTVQVPTSCCVEHDHGDDTPFVRLYTDGSEP